MSAIKLEALPRAKKGGNCATVIRSEGFIPAVLYGNKQDTEEIKVGYSDFIKILNNNGTSAQVQLKMGGKTQLAIVKDIQNDILTYQVTHIDFQRLSADQPIKIKIPIQLDGVSKVETNTTLVQHQLSELEIECLPEYLVESIIADVSNISLGEPFKVSDLEMFKNEKIAITNSPDEVIATLVENYVNDETEASSDEIVMPEVIGSEE